jgi:hypothetical protein
MRGALTQGDLSSWTVAGSYARALQAAHAYQVGFSYGMQRYSGGNAEALAAVRDGGRTVGVLYGYDTWTVVPAVKLEFGGRYANYGYLEEQGLLSPRAGIEVRPLDDPPRSSFRRRSACGCRRSGPSRRSRGAESSGRSASITSKWRPSARWRATSWSACGHSASAARIRS